MNTLLIYFGVLLVSIGLCWIHPGLSLAVGGVFMIICNIKES